MDAPADTPPIDLEALVMASLESLPPEFRDRLGSVAIVIDQEPSPAQLAATGARGLFGLYQGVPRTSYGADTAPVPSKITIFAGPLLRASRDRADLEARVRDTVLHEIAHHFGISDARLRELRASELGR
jgi:predicted Zn-dependent protease with MMP-like domain